MIPPTHLGRSISSRTQGAALVIVLAFLVLATFLVIAFFGTVSSEHRAAKVTSDLEAGRQLGEAAVQIVMGQIRAGTSRPNTAWASQPGMIRTYDDSGNPDEAFALYSTTNMVRDIPAAGGLDPSDDLPGPTWPTDRALWTDLNAPAAGRNDPTPNDSINDDPVFPIIDPRAAGVVPGKTAMIEGFSYDVTAMPGSVAPANNTDKTARLPLPVRWIYVLKDGTLTVPTNATGATANFDPADPLSPKTSNPIVGRIAFWTDDETSKLNINTACGGVPWDTPIGNSGLEMLFARYQPAKNEFSRYPGHPATVSLAPVFWSYLGMNSATDSLFPTFTPNWNTTLEMTLPPVLSTTATAFMDKIFPFAPRNSYGGSNLSTTPTAQIFNGANALSAVDSDRLYVSAEESVYGPVTGIAETDRPENPLGIGSSDLSKLKFFLTAQSRSPELNPFNLPKLCLWPLPDVSRRSVVNANADPTDTRSPLDRLIAFCSNLSYLDSTDGTNKTREYGFTRHNSTDPLSDFNATDAFNTLNNRILYSYLQSLLSRPLPGFGGSFGARYGTGGTQQILTGVYDFIRSQINLLDTSFVPANSSDYLKAEKVSKYAYAANIAGAMDGDNVTGPVGQVIPARLPNGTQGSGRFPVISQVSVEFIAQATNQPPLAGNPMHPWVPVGTGLGPYPTIEYDATLPTDRVATTYDPSRPGKFHTHPGLRYLTLPMTPGGTDYMIENPRYRGPALNTYETQIDTAFIISLRNPGAGIPACRPSFRLRVRGLANLKVNGLSIFPSSHDTQILSSIPGPTLEFNLGPSSYLLNGSNPLNASGDPINYLRANPVIVGNPADSGSTFTFGGDDNTVTIELLNPADDGVVQTYTLTFPRATLPTPLLPNPIPGDNRGASDHSFWQSVGFKPSFPPSRAIDLPPSSFLTFDKNSTLSTDPNFGIVLPPTETAYYKPGKTRFFSGSDVPNTPDAYFANLILPEWPVGNHYRGKLSSDTVRSLEVAFGDARLLTQMQRVPSDLFLPHRFYFDTKMRAAHSLRDKQHETTFEHLHGGTLQYLTSSSAVPSANLKPYAYDPSKPGGAWYAGSANPGDLWDVATGDDVKNLPYSRFVAGNNEICYKWPFTASTNEFDSTRFARYKASHPNPSQIPDFPTVWEQGGDYSSGFPAVMDGSMLGKVDEGTNRIDHDKVIGNRGIYPYFNDLATTVIVPVGPFLFSPNRQVPSPVVLGSIPSGYRPTFDPLNPRLSDITPWRTLLFAANPVGTQHGALSEVPRGGAVPRTMKAPDYTLLDFFWMPVIEPYAISEPLSTAGKVNMNSQLAPFTYVKRDTALHAAFRSTLITAVPDKWLNNKNGTGSGQAGIQDLGGNSSSINYSNFRYPINATETLKQFKVRFDAGDLFRSPSEICSLWLYPDKRSATDVAPPTWDANNTAISNWWYANPGTECKSVTGDNLREKPYGTLYPLLTTKSNTFTVHFKVQTLQKVPGTNASQWVEARDRVTSEYQGSQTIERYVDPTDPALPDFAKNTAPGDPTVSDYYRFRVLTNKRFVP